VNQEKIGKFIAECRKNKNLTQEELGGIIGVSHKSISKWENGKGMPDYGYLEKLCIALDINTLELFEGKRIKSKFGAYDTTAPMIYLGNLIKESKTKTKFFMFITIALAILLFVIAGIFVINNFNKVRLYSITTNNDYFIAKGFLKIYNEGNLLTIHQIGSLQDDKEIYSVEFSLISGDSVILKKGDIYEYEYNMRSPILSLHQEIKNTVIILSEVVSDEFFHLSDAKTNGMILEIRYLDKDFEEIVNTLQLEFVLKFANDRLIYLN